MSIGRRLSAGDTLPAWFSYGLFAVLVWCTTAGVSALILLCFDSYHPATCTVLATAATAAAWPFRPRARAGDDPAHGPALAALAIALSLFALAGVSRSEHVFTDRDPAVYINTGRSIARTHSVSPRIAPSPFDSLRDFSPKTAGFTIALHRLHPNFLQFLPALLALGWSAGGDAGLLLVPALLGALALLALYALASTIVGPRWALLGPALLVLAPLQSWFSRDAYTELPLAFLALGGIWLLIETRHDPNPTAGAIAGVILGATTFVRIDALAILVAIPAALAVELLRSAALGPRTRRRRRRTLLSYAIALGATVLTGLVVSRALSPGYMRDLRSDLRLLELAVAAGVVAAVAILVAHRVRAGIGYRLARNNTLLSLAGALTIAISLYAYVWRPRSGGPPKRVARQVLNAYYDASSFRWFAWYLGVFTLAFVVIGFIVLGVRAVRSDSPAFVLLAAAMPVTIFYIARPSISPDHLWAMRRYLPVVLPAMTIAAAAAAIWSTSVVGAWRPRLRAPFVVLVVAAMLVPAAIAGFPFVGAKTQDGALDAVHELCAAAGTDAAIAVEPYRLLGAELPQTLRGFCGVPTAGLVPNPAIALAAYAREWRDAGRQLYVASAAQRPVLAAASNAIQVAHVVVADSREPERTLDRRPRDYAPRPVEVWLYRVDPS